MMYLWLLLGFVFLVKGADLFVDGCSSIAKTLRVPSIIIGLTIVAFGTSAPEASVRAAAFILHVFHWRRKGSSADRTPGGAGSASVVRGISVYADQVSTEDPHHPA